MNQRIESDIVGDHRRLAADCAPGGPLALEDACLDREPVADPQEPVFESGACDRLDLLGAEIDDTDPGHLQPAMLHRDATGLLEEFYAITNAHDGRVDSTQHGVDPAEPGHFLFLALALRDVPEMHGEERPIGQLDRRHGELGGKLGPVPSHREKLAPFAQLLSGSVKALQISPVRCPRGGRKDEFCKLFSKRFGARIPEGLFRRRIEFEDSTFAIDGDDGIERRLDDCPVERFTRLESLLRVPAGRAFLPLLQGPQHGRSEPRQIGLQDIVGRTALERIYCAILPDGAGNENPRRVGAQLARERQSRQSVEPRQGKIEEDDVMRAV